MLAIFLKKHRYTIDKGNSRGSSNSGIVNDPNDLLQEHGQRYLLSLLLRMITVCVETVDIVNNLPTLDLEILPESQPKVIPDLQSPLDSNQLELF